MSNADRERQIIKRAKLLASDYRELATELLQAANVLENAANLQSAFPTVQPGRFAYMDGQRAILRALLEDRFR